MSGGADEAHAEAPAVSFTRKFEAAEFETTVTLSPRPLLTVFILRV